MLGNKLKGYTMTTEQIKFLENDVLFGYVNGVWNNETKQGEIKKIKMGDKLALGLSINLQYKDGDKYKTAMSVRVTAFIDGDAESEFRRVSELIKGQRVYVVGYKKGNYYKNDAGTEYRNAEFVCSSHNILSQDDYFKTLGSIFGGNITKAEAPAKKEEQEEIQPW